MIPKIHSGGTTPPQQVGVVGGSTAAVTQVVKYSGKQSQTPVQVVSEPTVAGRPRRRCGAASSTSPSSTATRSSPTSPLPGRSSDTATLVQVLAPELGVLNSYQQAGLSPQQIGQVAQARAVPVESLQTNKSKSVNKGTSVIGVILIFLMLTQYNTWILMGVMQEKASRVVEVLLATVRPVQLLGGKVLGIGLVALGQAALIVATAFIVSKAVGSSLLHGTGPC